MEIFEITRSKLRKELLRYYFLHPGGRFYLRQLEKLLKFSAANIRRELQKLTGSGLFASEKEGNLVYYSLNRKFHLYDEIKNIILKTAGLGDVFKKHMGRIKGIDYGFIYGSFTKGEEIATSDVDLMVIGDFSQEGLLKKINDIEAEIGKDVNPVSYSPKEIKDKIKRKNQFILNVLKGKKIMIIGDENELQKLGR